MVSAACYVCGKDELKVVRTKLRYDVERNVLECKNCGIIYLEPRPMHEDYYKEEYRKMYTPVLGKKLSSKELFDICLPQQQERVDALKEVLTPETRALDIGCSSGHFLHALKPHVKEVVGMEFNKADAEFVNKELGIKTYTTVLEETDLPQEHFDLITMFQVFEHMEDPLHILETIRKYLKPDGYLCIEVPNTQDALLSLYQNNAYANFWYREPHVFYYSPKTLEFVLKKTGFEGNIRTTQSFNLINHFNWILNNAPQKSNAEMAEPRLITSSKADSKIAEEFNAWFQNMNAEYKKLLNKHELGENVLFIGKKTALG